MTVRDQGEVRMRWKKFVCWLCGCDEIHVTKLDTDMIKTVNHVCLRCGNAYGTTTIEYPEILILQEEG